MAVSWITDYPATGPWERSINSGGTWAVYPSGNPNLGEVVGPVGTIRFRQLITTPPGVTAEFLRLFIRGDLFELATNPAEVRVDGVLISQLVPAAQSFTGPGQGIFIPMSSLSPGPHSVEIWVGATSTVSGSTYLLLAQASLIEPERPCNCGTPTWIPAAANNYTGFSASPQTIHVNATAAAPTFTVLGPVRGIRFRAPDIGAAGSLSGDGAILFSFSTTETGPVTVAGWTPAIPASPGTVAGPNTKTQLGVNMTLNSDGRLSQASGASWRLAIEDVNNVASPNFEFFTLEFSQPVTNLVFTGSAYTGTPPNEGISQLAVLSDSPPCNCCPLLSLAPRCYIREELLVPFTSATVIANPAGHSIANLGLSIDRVTSQATLIGFSPPVAAGQNPNPGTQFEFTFAAPVDNLVRLQWYNGGGGDLTDQDGFGNVTFDFFDSGGSLLRTVTHDFTAPLANNNPPRSVPLSPAVKGVSRIVTRQMQKQNIAVAGAGSPLFREIQAFRAPLLSAVSQICNGVIRWFDAETGDVVDPDSFVSCGGCIPEELPTSFTNGSFELPVNTNNSSVLVPIGSVPGWQANGANLEFWNSPFTAGVAGLLPYPGGSDQLIELDSAPVATIFQNVTVPVQAGTVRIGYWHHTRSGATVWTVRAFLGDAALPQASDTMVDESTFPTASPNWHFRTGEWFKPAGLTLVRFRLTTVAPGGAVSNLIDETTFQFFTACS